jgi:hypothetical protein
LKAQRPDHQPQREGREFSDLVLPGLVEGCLIRRPLAHTCALGDRRRGHLDQKVLAGVAEVRGNRPQPAAGLLVGRLFGDILDRC